MSLTSRYGNWALVTGAARATGLGYEFARQLAQQGFNLVLVDKLGDELELRATELREKANVEVRPVTLDFLNHNFIDALLSQTEDIEIGLLVCNHMFTRTDTPRMFDMTLQEHYDILDINARAYVTLVYTYGKMMVERGHGGILIVASNAALVSVPYNGPYTANKAFQLGFGEALWYELRGTGVDVMTLTPGLTNTYPEGMKGFPAYLRMETTPVVEEALAHMGKKHWVIPGFINKLLYIIQVKLMGRRRAVMMGGAAIEQGMGK